MEQEIPITGLLNSWASQPSHHDARVFALVYDRLHDIAAAHFAKRDQIRALQPTEVLNEAFLRLVKSSDLHWENREHFFACSSRVMRHVLVDFAKHTCRVKRGAGAHHVTLDESLQDSDTGRCEEVLATHQALEALERVDPERARIVELRYFGGLSSREIAETLDISESTVHRRWRLARAWLFAFLHQDN
ncbi:MAG: ECF-type sigma factor [Acidobacteriota bacterium]